MYWDIFKNYYANKQEPNAYAIHTGSGGLGIAISKGNLFTDFNTPEGDIYNNVISFAADDTTVLEIVLANTKYEPDPSSIDIDVNAAPTVLTEIFDTFDYDETTNILRCTD